MNESRTLDLLSCPHYALPASAKSMHYLLLPVNHKLSMSRPSWCPNRKQVMASRTSQRLLPLSRASWCCLLIPLHLVLPLQFLVVFCFLNISLDLFTYALPIYLPGYPASLWVNVLNWHLMYMSWLLTIGLLVTPNLDPLFLDFLSYMYLCSMYSSASILKSWKEKTLGGGEWEMLKIKYLLLYHFV